MTKKKIILVIVEGTSDETALGLLNKIYENQKVYIQITYGDITTRKGVNPQNVINKVNEYVKKSMEYGGFKKKDFQEIIHITDTDGTYISNDKIFANLEQGKVLYKLDGIYIDDPSKIILRNKQKRDNLLKLRNCSKIQNIPYAIYYMSCNLDHVLYDCMNLSDDEKETYAYAFVENYENDLPGLVRFFCESEFSVNKEFKSSWEFIEKGNNSLERYTNFSICIRKAYEIRQSV